MKNYLVLLFIVLACSVVDVLGFTAGQYVSIFIICLLCGKNIKMGNNGFIHAILLLALTNVLRISQYSVFLFKDVGMIFIGIMPFLVGTRFKVNIFVLNYCLFMAFLVAVGMNLFSIHITSQSIIDSNIGIELGILGFIFPLFAIYFAVKRNRLMVLLNVILTIASGKRIAVIGMLVGLVASRFFTNEKTVQRKYRFVVMSFIYVFIALTYLFAIGSFDSWIYETFGVSANYLSMGRQNRYSTIIGNNNLDVIWGIGAGNTQNILKEEFLAAFRLHNDFLKVLVENGILIFILFVYIIFNNVRNYQFPILLYIIILFMTDNTLIYSTMLFMYGLFLNQNIYFHYKKK